MKEAEIIFVLNRHQLKDFVFMCFFIFFTMLHALLENGKCRDICSAVRSPIHDVDVTYVPFFIIRCAFFLFIYLLFVVPFFPRRQIFFSLEEWKKRERERESQKRQTHSQHFSFAFLFHCFCSCSLFVVCSLFFFFLNKKKTNDLQKEKTKHPKTKINFFLPRERKDSKNNPCVCLWTCEKKKKKK